MSFDKIFDLTAGVYFNFYNIHMLDPHFLCSPVADLSSRFSLFYFQVFFMFFCLCSIIDVFSLAILCYILFVFVLLPNVNTLLCMLILNWVLLSACCRTVLMLRCDIMQLLNLNAHKSCALCGVAVASSCYTVCMLYDTYRVPAPSESILLLFTHIKLNTAFCLSYCWCCRCCMQHGVCG